MPYSLVLTIGAIVVLDIVLSGDNALVIGAAANKLPRTQRALAIFWGGLLAVLLRISLTVAATTLFQIPWLQAIGGVLLFLVAVRVIWPGAEDENIRTGRTFATAMAAIVIADLTMSLDNILAIAALAHGQILPLVIGLACSMLFLFTASAIIARVMDVLPWLLDVAAAVIAFTAAQLFFADSVVNATLRLDPQELLIAEVASVVGVLLIDLVLRLVVFRKKSPPRG